MANAPTEWTIGWYVDMAGKPFGALNIWARYALVDDDVEYSATSGDYFMHGEDSPLPCKLVRMNHPYMLRVGGWLTGPRILKSAPTVRDLRKLERARERLVKRYGR